MQSRIGRCRNSTVSQRFKALPQPSAKARPEAVRRRHVPEEISGLGNRNLTPDPPRITLQRKTLSADGATVQPKLTLGPVDDPYEREADRVAQQVVSQLGRPAPKSEASVAAEPEAISEKHDDESTVQPKLQVGMAEGGPVDSSIESSIQQARSGGRGLDKGVRSSMESAFGADFSGVKVHADSKADSLNRSLSARAFTTGKNIFFRQGEYQPQSSSGKQLLAHELTHVVQQTGTGVRKDSD